jgi:SOS response associated peptidase (SRAP)
VRKEVFRRYANRSRLLFLGLWDCWLDRDTGRQLYTFTIITTRANALVRRIHDRMPVIYDAAMGRQWLDGPHAGWLSILCCNRFPRNEWNLTKFRRSSIPRRTILQLAFSLLRPANQLSRSCRSSSEVHRNTAAFMTQT